MGTPRTMTPPSTTPPQTTPPQTLLAGRYRLVEPVGQGGMGRVWLATDEVLGRQVAIKEVVAPAELTPDEARDMGARALREARAAARLSHPNVVTVYDVVVVDTAPWIVMEYLPARSLSEVVNRSGPMTPAAAARVGLAVLSALRAAHGVGVLHRDVKPGNVLLADDGRVVLTDFGLATMVGDPAVTRSGLVIGSPSYMAPERVRDTRPGAPADLWSLGATLYFAVEGRSPYERDTALATVAALTTEEPDPSSRAGALAPVIEGLLRRDPDARLSAPAVARLLAPVAEGAPPARGVAGVVAPTGAPPARPVRPRSEAGGMSGWAVTRPGGRRTWVVVLAVAVLALVGLAAWVITRPSSSPPAASAGELRSGAPAPSTGPPAARSTGPTPGPATSGPATPTSAGDPVVLPPGWRTYKDRTGFAVAVPARWRVSREGTIVYFREPNGSRLLGIDQTDRPRPDPVKDWRGKERYRVNQGDFPGYERVRLEAVDYFDKAADWEFTYVRSGTRLHVNNRGFITSPTQAYGMWWSTADSNWERYLPDLRLIQRSFVPAED
jgi:eukaryotic-like serine/threonine-protein kinase